MIGDLLRAFVAAVLVRELLTDLPSNAKVDAIRSYPDGSWAIDWSIT